MKHERLFPCLQELATCTYPEPDESNPRPPTLIDFNIILPFTYRSRNWSLFFGFPHKHYVFSLVSHTCHMTHPSHSSLFDHPNCILCGVQMMKLLTVRAPQVPLTSTLLGPDIFLSTLFSSALCLCSFLNVGDQVLHPYKTTGKIIVLYILSCPLLGPHIVIMWRAH